MQFKTKDLLVTILPAAKKDLLCRFGRRSVNIPPYTAVLDLFILGDALLHDHCVALTSRIHCNPTVICPPGTFLPGGCQDQPGSPLHHTKPRRFGGAERPSFKIPSRALMQSRKRGCRVPSVPRVKRKRWSAD